MNLHVKYPTEAQEGLAIYVAAGLIRAGHQAVAQYAPDLAAGLAIIGPYDDDDRDPTPDELIEAGRITATVARLCSQYRTLTAPPEEFQP